MSRYYFNSNSKMKILCITCMYDRPQVSAIFLTGMRRLGIQVLVAVSTAQDMAVCDRYNTEYVLIKNDPLGTKWNTIATHAVEHYDFTHLLISGDDNVYSSDILELWEDHKICNFSGLSATYFIHPKDKRAAIFRYKTTPPLVIGTGRLINRTLLLGYTKHQTCSVIFSKG